MVKHVVSGVTMMGVMNMGLVRKSGYMMWMACGVGMGCITCGSSKRWCWRWLKAIELVVHRGVHKHERKRKAPTESESLLGEQKSLNREEIKKKHL